MARRLLMVALLVALTHALNKQRQRIVEQTKLAAKGTANCSNATVVYVAATLGSDSKDDRSEFLRGYQRALPGVRILRGVNGYNTPRPSPRCCTRACPSTTSLAVAATGATWPTS